VFVHVEIEARNFLTTREESGINRLSFVSQLLSIFFSIPDIFG